MNSTLALGLEANVIALAAVGAGWRQNHDTLANQRRLAGLDDVAEGMLVGGVLVTVNAAPPTHLQDRSRSQSDPGDA